MKLENLEKTSNKQFRRITGVKRSTFDEMVVIVQEAHVKKHSRGGRPNNLTVPNMILMALEYLREYRTYASIGVSYGIAESNAYTTIRWVEDVLIQSGKFRLEGKKALASEDEIEMILIDATESPIERPKKNSAGITQERKKDTPSRRK